MDLLTYLSSAASMGGRQGLEENNAELEQTCSHALPWHVRDIYVYHMYIYIYVYIYFIYIYVHRPQK